MQLYSLTAIASSLRFILGKTQVRIRIFLIDWVRDTSKSAVCSGNVQVLDLPLQLQAAALKLGVSGSRAQQFLQLVKGG